jgi:ParB-like chromosome segregation protein Spo0J
MKIQSDILEIKSILNNLDSYELDEKVNFINAVKQMLHDKSPFKNEPVDCVIWVKSDGVVANDYNPNKVAPPEMQLLEVSIDSDGYTQPIVTYAVDGKNEVIDGFHRSRVGKESSIINKRVHNYLPVVVIRDENTDKNNRIASTIRHNRARGKHQVDAMSEIVLELKNRNWTNKRVARELGMDEDEILRLCQISGLADIFSDADFNKAWEAGDSIHDFEPLTDEIEDDEDYGRTVNTSDEDRIFHTYEKWECAKAGFYASTKDGMKSEQCIKIFADFLKDTDLFAETLEKVITEWKHSCEHYLTNKAMNRIAWLGQASVCYAKGIPSVYSSGWNLLTPDEQEKANEVALEYLNKWFVRNNREEITMEDALSIGRQIEIY